MRICLLLPSFLPAIGGLEKAADCLATTLVSWGHQPVVLTQTLRHKSNTIARSYPIHDYPRPRSSTWLPLSPAIALRRLHRQYEFDLVWAFQAYPMGYVAVNIGRQNNLPVVISSRGGDLSRRSRYLSRWLPRKRMIWALTQAHAVTVLNQYLVQRVKELTGARVKPVLIFNGCTIPSLIPINEPIPLSLHAVVEKPYILTLTRLRYFKGMDVMIETMRQLKEKGHHIPKLVIAGEGPQRQLLQQQVTQNKLQNQIVFIGTVTGYEKAWLLANCQCLVQPSRVGEGMPNAILEAMSYGKPVLGTQSPGIADIIIHGENGILAPPDNPTALAQATMEILHTDLDQLSRKAQEFAIHNSWEKCTRQYLELFEKICG